MNEKAIESMNKDEPETALEFLKKVDDTLSKIENKRDEESNNSDRKSKHKSNHKRVSLENTC